MPLLRFCCRFNTFWLFWRFWKSRYMYSRGLIGFINFSLYATTKSWHAHQKICLDELVWNKLVSDVFHGTIYWVIDKTVWKPSLVTVTLLCFAEMFKALRAFRRAGFRQKVFVNLNGWRLMPPTLELVFTRSPYALKTIQRQCHLCLRVLSVLHPQKDLWGAHGSFFGALGAIFMPRTHFFSFRATFWDCLGNLGVPGWSRAGFIEILWGTFGVHFARQFPSVSSSSWSWAVFSRNFRQMFLGEAFLDAFSSMAWSPET